MLHILNVVWNLFNTVYRGYLIKTFWAWFIVSQFPSLPTVTILPAIGFSFFVSCFAPWKEVTLEQWEEAKAVSADERLNTGLLNAMLFTLGTTISLGLGWVVHHFM